MSGSDFLVLCIQTRSPPHLNWEYMVYGGVIVYFWILFFLFMIIAAVAANVLDGFKTKQKTDLLRLAIERSQPIDPIMLDTLSPPKMRKVSSEVLLIVGILAIAVASGLGLAAIFFGQLNAKALLILPGVASLLLCIGLGFLIAYRFTRDAVPVSTSP